MATLLRELVEASETTESYYRARYYDSGTARFLSEDPLELQGDDVNFYQYAGNDPTDFSDPEGLRKYKCSVFGGCSKIPFGPGLKKPCNCKGGARLPDFISGSFSVTLPWTGGFGSYTVSAAVDRYGNFYLSPFGPGIGRAPGRVSGTLTPNWILERCKPSEADLSNLLNKGSWSGAAGYWVGGTVSCPQNPSGCTEGSGAAGAGFVSPQVGGNYSYSFKLGNLNIHW